MKQRAPLVIGVILVAVIVGAVLVRSQGTAPGSSAPASPSAPEGTAPEGPVAYTFKDDQALREFAEIWRSRQNVTVRMTILQSYWNREQALLAETAGQLKETYGVEPSENYFLNTEKRVLVERSASVEDQPAGETPPETAATPETTPVDGREIHSFQDEAAMQAFAQLWQQRQSIILRMKVLEAYWRNEQDALTDINGQLASGYKLDTTKNYFLDGQRRVIIEVAQDAEAPPAAPAAPDAPAPDAPAVPAATTP
jgi:hypothetical protein